MAESSDLNRQPESLYPPDDPDKVEAWVRNLLDRNATHFRKFLVELFAHRRASAIYESQPNEDFQGSPEEWVSHAKEVVQLGFYGLLHRTYKPLCPPELVNDRKAKNHWIIRTADAVATYIHRWGEEQRDRIEQN